MNEKPGKGYFNPDERNTTMKAKLNVKRLFFFLILLKVAVGLANRTMPIDTMTPIESVIVFFLLVISCSGVAIMAVRYE